MTLPYRRAAGTIPSIKLNTEFPAMKNTHEKAPVASKQAGAQDTSASQHPVEIVPVIPYGIKAGQFEIVLADYKFTRKGDFKLLNSDTERVRSFDAAAGRALRYAAAQHRTAYVFVGTVRVFCAAVAEDGAISVELHLKRLQEIKRVNYVQRRLLR